MLKNMYFYSSREWPGTNWDARHNFLNIVKINIDYILAEITECKTSNKQEMQGGTKCYTNKDLDDINKQDTNGQKDQKSANKPINYFFSSNNTDVDKRKSSKMTQKYTTGLVMYSWHWVLQRHIFFTAKTRQQAIPGTPRNVAYALQKPFKEKLE